jgi:3-hydroxyisobutyrate dehydrogenase-like beta-hydroxyacid dehydrogenase
MPQKIGKWSESCHRRRNETWWEDDVRPTSVGYIGVGLMGHGAAKNILEKGYELTILGNLNRKPVDDLVRRGAREAKSPAEVAQACDVVFTCLPSSVEMETTVFARDGLLDAMKPGAILVDSTTADPNATRRIGAALAERGIGMVDGPLGRSPKEAEAGKLNTFLGGDAATIAKVRPIIACYAETIIEAGALGDGHTLKLVNNFISIGTSAVIAEALATASKLGLDMRKLFEVVSSGGANSAMFQMMMPWTLDGDDSRLKGPLRIAGKDMRFYCRLAESAQMASFVAQAVNQTYQLANSQGHGERFMPVLPGVLAQLNGAKIRDL